MKLVLRPLLCLIALSLILSSVTAVQAAPKKSDLKAEVISLKITKGKAHFEENKKYDLQKDSSIELKILVTSPTKAILGFKKDSSKLIRFDDDQGTNLLKEKNGRRTASFWPFTNYYDKKRQCVVTLNSPGTPSSKAGKLHLQAELVFQCASDKTATKEAKITPSTGGSFTFGDAKVAVSDKAEMSFGSPDSNKKKGHVSFKSSKPFDNIASITFFDTKGKKIKHEEAGSGSMGFMGKKEYYIGYDLDRKMNTYIVKITYYSGGATVTIPIDQKIGVGL